MDILKKDKEHHYIGFSSYQKSMVRTYADITFIEHSNNLSTTYKVRCYWRRSKKISDVLACVLYFICLIQDMVI